MSKQEKRAILFYFLINKKEEERGKNHQATPSMRLHLPPIAEQSDSTTADVLLHLRGSARAMPEFPFTEHSHTEYYHPRPSHNDTYGNESYQDIQMVFYFIPHDTRANSTIYFRRII
jgi:hypothetical protein